MTYILRSDELFCNGRVPFNLLFPRNLEPKVKHA
uniref:Putative LRR receptor-like serine/threonine-protein kinase At1g56140 n=1 Tax=Rhizophora mucronata TaxID=61149 RepID=A0A2P2MWM6_RHIMU